MKNYSINEFPKSRIATLDVVGIGKQRNHMSALLECDVTESRNKIKALKLKGDRISFTGWLLKVIGTTLKEHNQAAAFLLNKKSVIIFDNINISILIEKKLRGMKVPIPLVIERTNNMSIIDITKEIEAARNEVLSDDSIVLNQKPKLSEKMYYYLPGYFRRLVWKYILSHPRLAYKKMGNVAVTSIGMFGQIKGWFIHSTIHPISFGIGSVIKKPVVINNEIKIRDMLNMTVLIDHDVIDGAPMVRFISDLVKSIENGREL